MGRIEVAALTLSAATLIGIAVHEGYSDDAYIPIKGDIPTLGFGSTKDVHIGDKTDPIRALIRLGKEVSVYEEAVKKCAPVPMYSYEFSAYVSLTYNIGGKAFCSSTLVKKLNSGDYEGACKEILRWNKAGGEEIKGLTIRRQEEYQQCIGK